MQFSTKTILALSIISTSGVNGHGQLTQPDGPQAHVDGVDVNGIYGNGFYTQGELNQTISN